MMTFKATGGEYTGWKPRISDWFEWRPSNGEEWDGPYLRISDDTVFQYYQFPFDFDEGDCRPWYGTIEVTP